MFIHSVYFTLNPDLTPEQLQAFEGGLASLGAVDVVKSIFIGKPAATDRPVVVRDYAYALIVDLGDRQGHDIYQSHPVHLEFVRDFSTYWTGIKVFDCE